MPTSCATSARSPRRRSSRKRAETVEPGFLTRDRPGRSPRSTPTATSTGRRRALADWIASPTNPLTARVIVNRIWQQHFGRGLTASTSDFGKLGEEPSHPELLDWLADTFVKDGWSIKKLHRRIVTSAAYRQATGARRRRHRHEEGSGESPPVARLDASPRSGADPRRAPRRHRQARRHGAAAPASSRRPRGAAST